MQLVAQESLQRALQTVAIKCIKTKMKIHHKKHKRDGIGLIQKPRGHKEDRASFPNQIQYKLSQIHGQIYSKERNTGAAAWRNRESTNRLQKPQLT